LPSGTGDGGWASLGSSLRAAASAASSVIGC
jgi:hypothetical protein